ncbi:MAG TPA: hypothetical protein VGU23_06085 [Acidobacteriaceae bacterium]|nr:hypothetical protein [Acidobacteriaceae bacterium]
MPLELSISPRSDAAPLPHCVRARRGLAGIVRVDPATSQITHLEYTLPVASAQPIHSPSFLSADYAPAKVGDKIFWLPTTVTARWFLSDKRKTPVVWHSRYSDYHLYTASTRILSATPEP